LFGYKRFSYISLEKIHKLVKNFEYRTENGKLEFIKYLNGMRYDPNIDNWNDVSDFYTIS